MPERRAMTPDHPADPLAHAAQTLLAGGGLPGAWRGAPAWTVLDLDFGAGAAFLATLRAWRDDPGRPARLHYAALLASPVPRDTLTDPRTSPDARALRARWPIPVTGVHRIAFACGRVLLTLAVGPSASMLPGRVPHADTLFVALRAAAGTAVAPAGLRAACAMLADGALAAVATLAPDDDGDARRATLEASARVLAGAGFAISGNATGGLRAVRIRGPGAPRRSSRSQAREAMVIGAGLAGSAVAFALARRGWTVHRLGDPPVGAADGSGQPALAFHPSVTPDDAPLSRLTRSALLLARGAYDVGAARFGGRLQLDEPAHAQAAAAGWPAEWVEAVDAARAGALAGVSVTRGGLWLPMAGSADPHALCDGWTVAGVHTLNGRTVARLDALPHGWRARDAHGATLAEAPIAIVATGARDLALQVHEGCGPVPLWSRLGAAGLSARTGRTTIAAVPPQALPACVLGGDGHAVPLDGARLLLGPADGYTGPPGPDEREAAWRRFAAGLADGASLPTPMLAPGPTGTRLSTRDHLPLAGPVPDPDAIAAARARLRRDDRLPLPVLPGLHVAGAFGGRGLLWSVLVAELLAARLDAEPSPLERGLAAALDPGRFLRRSLRRDDVSP
jgi:tRNA 5-methylaminomethyl-2-thiouridine biosynthesis bifunctional protein